MTKAQALVREARGRDLAGIVALDALRAGQAKPGYWRRILDQYAGAGGADERVALVATDDAGAVCGFLFGEVRAWEFGSERCGWIFAVAVSPSFERRGLATRLCEDAIGRFASIGVGLVRTMVRRDDVPMLALFRSMSFSGGAFCELERPVAARSEEREGAA